MACHTAVPHGCSYRDAAQFPIDIALVAAGEAASTTRPSSLAILPVLSMFEDLAAGRRTLILASQASGAPVWHGIWAAAVACMCMRHGCLWSCEAAVDICRHKTSCCRAKAAANRGLAPATLPTQGQHQTGPAESAGTDLPRALPLLDCPFAVPLLCHPFPLLESCRSAWTMRRMPASRASCRWQPSAPLAAWWCLWCTPSKRRPQPAAVCSCMPGCCRTRLKSSCKCWAAACSERRHTWLSWRTPAGGGKQHHVAPFGVTSHI